MSTRQRVLGLGGVFLRARDPEALGAWYARHLGLDVMDFGGPRGAILPLDGTPGQQVWTLFPEGSDAFGDARQPAMLNFRVADLDAILAQLRAEGLSVEADVQRSEHGAFGWVRDAEGNRVELWQPPEA